MPILTALSPQIFNLITSAFGIDTSSDETKVKLAELELKARTLVSTEMAGQVEVNKIEAASPNLFVAGWRPSIGWVCSASLAAIVGVSMIQWLNTGVQPNLDFVWAIMGSLLGVGTMRTYEKVQKVTK